ncbi:required for excision 1-B domain-containing protein isoform X2 [Galendromus occidentalis]|uniref:Required for excision 1-B domain-containing protein isoform X2 n=1 Tax=Galendromus occidentalis TaxID=34638 RepID=A0AAJ6QUS1_9ACAR|nr:required for excision 1-B domain-containing protein isoform X2 [Galendromus occidentalis]
MALDVAEGDVIYLLQKFKALQEERIYTYNVFHEGHKLYLASAPNYNFPQFRQLVHDVTQEFRRISEGIIELEERIRPIDPKLASVIQHLQEAEKTKLRVTARKQLAEQRLQDSPEVNHELANELAMMRKTLITVTQTIVDCCEEVKYALQEYMNQDRASVDLET